MIIQTDKLIEDYYKSIKDKDIKMVVDHTEWRRKKLQTPIAKEIGKYLSMKISKKRAREIVELSSKLAFNSVVTEKIVFALKKVLSEKENTRLREQLNLNYLKKF